MDFAVTRSFRNALTDLTLIYDAGVYVLLRQPHLRQQQQQHDDDVEKQTGALRKEVSLSQAFKESLEIIIQEECRSLLETQHQLPHHQHHQHHTIMDSTIQELIYFSFHMFRDVFLQFAVEEFIQYVFFQYKVSSIIIDTTLNNSRTIYDVIQQLQQEIIDVCHYPLFSTVPTAADTWLLLKKFNPFVPYLMASAIYNFDDLSTYFSSCITAFFKQYVPSSSVYRMFSSSQLMDLDQQEQQQKRSGGANSKYPETVSPTIVEHKVTTTNSSTNSIVKRLFSTMLAHPFLSFSLHMIADNEANVGVNNGVVVAVRKLFTQQGVGGFFHGLRSAVLFSLLPLSPLWTLGIPETLVYRLIINNQSTDNLPSVLAQWMRDRGQVTSLFRFGAITYFTIAAQFGLFCLSKMALQLLFGVSANRRLQVQKRVQILDNHFQIMTRGRK